MSQVFAAKVRDKEHRLAESQASLARQLDDEGGAHEDAEVRI